MSADEIVQSYRDYIACLNCRDWAGLDLFVHEDVRHNGRLLGLSGYSAMLQGNVRDIPDLTFEIGTLVSNPPQIAARLLFDCTPTGVFMGLPVNGRRVAFAEHAFYEYRDGKIWDVTSVIDKAAVEAQL
ncbi:ester cyclase [Pleomorphomonas diazotrophica]|uniref:Ester cyclase n=1 Tax=Pleomorphomonas diazotrophica TaxID=1166257 RepID=A0A1I4S5A3_9HYPH|nr:ester cyclase [Pleomorphomonas diazotrophica]PKR89937.1 ester cyclase [Pleomorphomonas diazotrophica]SFM59677.1 Predicted ester cyclase [Pleomorphomonas diazotrophica]